MGPDSFRNGIGNFGDVRYCSAHTKLQSTFGVLSTIFTPIIYGGAIAYLLAPIVDFLSVRCCGPGPAVRPGANCAADCVWSRTADAGDHRRGGVSLLFLISTM